MLQMVPMDLADLIRRRSTLTPAAVALTFAGQHTICSELDAASNQVANTLLTINPSPNWRIAVIARNSVAFYELLFGAAKARHVLIPVNWRLAASEVAAILTDAGVELLVVGAEFVALVEEIRDRLPVLRHVIALTDDHPAWESFADWRDRHDAVDPVLPVAPSDVALQLYTSGTTGRPKGVQLTHDNLAFTLAHIDEYFPCTAADVVLACFPHFHVVGILDVLSGLVAGARSVLLPQADPDEILAMIVAERVSVIDLVPSLIRFLLQSPACRDTDVSSLRLIIYGAAPMPLDLLREAMATFGCGFIQLYGLTETTGLATGLSLVDHDPNSPDRLRSCGKPLAGTGLRIVDRAGRDVPNGDIGEIVLRGRQIMRGYWNVPEATAEAIRDGWFHTGDAGYLDADGYLYVIDVAVIGIPDARWGETVKAVVVRRPGSVVSEGDLIAFSRTQVAHYKAPTSIDFIDMLPRTASGKLAKDVLRAPYWADRDRQVI